MKNCVNASLVAYLQAQLSLLIIIGPIGQIATTQPTTQDNLKQLGVVLLSVRKNHHTTKPHHYHVITFKAVQSNLGSWFLVCNLNITQLEEIWKTTSIFLKMKDLNNFENGRRPQYFWKCKTTSIFLKMEDDLNIFENVRRPQYF